MSDYLSKNFNFRGADYTLNVLSGTVINTDTRSDTHVYGTGSHANGQGHSSVSSYVTVTKDVWIRGLSGKEYCLKFGDIAIREGNIIHHGALKGSDSWLFLHNRNTEDFWTKSGNFSDLKISRLGFLKPYIAFLLPWSIYCISILLSINAKFGFYDSFRTAVLILGCPLVPAWIFSLPTKDFTIPFKVEAEKAFQSLRDELDSVTAQLKGVNESSIVVSGA